MITRKDELKSRIEARKAALEARLKTAKADAQAASRREQERIEKQLESIRTTLHDGWDNLTEAAARKLNELLKEDAA